MLSHSPHLETGLVLIKPDNLQRASSLPGHIIDLFGTLGLHIVGVKLFSMTLNQGKSFYGFLEDVRDHTHSHTHSRTHTHGHAPIHTHSFTHTHAHGHHPDTLTAHTYTVFTRTLSTLAHKCGSR